MRGSRRKRQAIALMEHQHIARILDAGETLVVDLFSSWSWCGVFPSPNTATNVAFPSRSVSVCFLDVCQAVQHAHQKGIIHRDLKPSNILITLHDGTPVVKVIDFGIAKVIGQQLTDKELVTGFAQMIGTPKLYEPRAS